MADHLDNEFAEYLDQLCEVEKKKQEEYEEEMKNNPQYANQPIERKESTDSEE